MQNISVPRFKAADINHARLADLSYQCHAAKQANRQDEVTALESEIDEVTANLWNINDAELKAIQMASADL